MITVVFGLPGAGKSTFLAYCADCALQGKDITIGFGPWKTKLNSQKKYEKIYCNFPIFGTYKLDFDELGEKDFHNCLILIDEIQLLCDSRNWKNFTENSKLFFSLHRKYGVDCCVCGQRYQDADSKIRALASQFCMIENRGRYSKITPLAQYQRLVNGAFSEGYDPAPPLGCTWLPRNKYYWLFDSFARPELAPLESVQWSFGDVSRPPSFARRALSAVEWFGARVTHGKKKAAPPV